MIAIKKLHKQFTNKSQQYLTKLIPVVKKYLTVISTAQQKAGYRHWQSIAKSNL